MAEVDSEGKSSKLTASPADARWYAKLLLGDDVFISYARRDGSDYVLALANRLISEGISCFIDQFDGGTGITLPPGVLKALARCSMLVIVATPGTLGSSAVEQEIRLFRDRPGRTRPIVVIELGQTLSLPCSTDRPDWRPLTVGIHPAPEPLDALSNMDVSNDIVKRIVGSATFTLRNKRLRNIGTASALLVAGLLVVAGALTWKASSSASEIAQKGKELAAQQELMRVTEDKLHATQAQVAKGEADKSALTAVGDRLRLENADSQLQLTQSLQQAKQAKSYSDSLDMAEASERELDAAMPHRALRLALGAMQKQSTAEARRSLVRAIERYVPNLELTRDGYVSGGGFLSDERLVAVVKAEKLGLWSTETGRKQSEVSGIGNRLAFPPFDGDPCWLLNNQAYCWDSGAKISHLLEGSAVEMVERMAFNPTGKLVAIHDQNGRKVAVWNTSGGVPLFEQDHTNGSSLAFVANGVVATRSGGDGDELILFELPSGKATSIGKVHAKVAGQLTASADGLWFAIPTSDGVEVWSSSSLERTDIAFEDAYQTRAQLSTKGDVLWAEGADGGFAFLHEGKIVDLMKPPRESGEYNLDVSLSPVPRMFATYDNRRVTVSILDNERHWRVQSTLDGHTNRIFGAVFSQDARRLLTWDGLSARLWDATPRPSLEAAQPVKDSLGIPYSTRLSADGRTVLFERDGVLWVVDEDGSSHSVLKRDVNERSPYWYSMAFDATGGHFVASRENDPYVFVWRVGRWNDPVQLQAGTIPRNLANRGRSVLVSARGDRVASLDDHFGLRIWDTALAKPIVHRNDTITELLGMSPDGRLIAFTNLKYPAEVVVWDCVQNRDVLTTNGLARAGSLGSFDRSGNYFVSSSQDADVLQVWRIAEEMGGVRIVKLSTIRETREVRTWNANWSWDGRLLVTRGTYDSASRVWETATGNLLFEGGETLAAAFLGDTSSLVLVDSDKIRRKGCQPCASVEDLVALGERRLRTGRW